MNELLLYIILITKIFWGPYQLLIHNPLLMTISILITKIFWCSYQLLLINHWLMMFSTFRISMNALIILSYKKNIKKYNSNNSQNIRVGIKSFWWFWTSSFHHQDYLHTSHSIHACTYIYIYTYIYVCICICICICMCMCICICMCMCMCLCNTVCVCVCVLLYAYTYKNHVHLCMYAIECI